MLQRDAARQAGKPECIHLVIGYGPKSKAGTFTDTLMAEAKKKG